MSLASLDLAARDVLGRFLSPALSYSLVALGNRGGFSGARLWRVHTTPVDLCLRAWPPGDPSPGRLDDIHRLMTSARASGLAFVPAVRASPQGITCFQHSGRLWDLTTWMPGEADSCRNPGCRRVEAACTALGRLHCAWAAERTTGRCPAVGRRLENAATWQELIESGWRPEFHDPRDPVRSWAERAWRALQVHTSTLGARLAPWVGREVLLHPCLCDIWHDHVLFDGDIVTGLIDFGGIKLDHVAVDLARLLGSLAAHDPELRTAGLRAYSTLRPLTLEEEALVTVLDETGTLLGAANWLRWLYREGRQYENRIAVARRLEELVKRIEKWTNENCLTEAR